MLCVWWDQCGVVYFELLKPGETVTTDRYRQQIINLNHALIEKRPEWVRVWAIVGPTVGHAMATESSY